MHRNIDINLVLAREHAQSDYTNPKINKPLGLYLNY